VSWRHNNFLSCHLRLQNGHLPHTLSLSKAFDLSFTPTAKLSVRQRKGVRWCAQQMVCAKTTDAHLTKVAAAAFRSATAVADQAQVDVARLRDALQSDVSEQPDVARGAIMARAAAALSSPNARAAMVGTTRTAVYHLLLATGLAAGMPREVALLYEGARKAGVDFGNSLSGEAPNSTIVRRAVRKRLADAAAEKQIAQVPRSEGQLGSVGGANTPIRV